MKGEVKLLRIRLRNFIVFILVFILTLNNIPILTANATTVTPLTNYTSSNINMLLTNIKSIVSELESTSFTLSTELREYLSELNTYELNTVSAIDGLSSDTETSEIYYSVFQDTRESELVISEKENETQTVNTKSIVIRSTDEVPNITSDNGNGFYEDYNSSISSSLETIKLNIFKSILMSTALELSLGRYFELQYPDTYNYIRNLDTGSDELITIARNVSSYGTGDEDLIINLSGESITIPSINTEDNSVIYNAVELLHKLYSSKNGLGSYFSVLFKEYSVNTSPNQFNNTANELYRDFTYRVGLNNYEEYVQPSNSNTPLFLQGGLYNIANADSYFSTNENKAKDNLYYINISNIEDITTLRTFLYSIVDYNTFISTILVRYGIDLSQDSSFSSSQLEEIKSYLENWKSLDGKFIAYIIQNFEVINKIFSYANSDELDFEKMSSNIKAINSVLSSFNITEFSLGTTETINDINQYTTLGIVRDLFTETENGSYVTSDVYNELLAWSSGFIPFQTNLYNSISQTEVLSGQAKAVWSEYYKLRQPLLITNDTSNVYKSLVSATPMKLTYATLQEYITRIQNEQDVFLFLNTYTANEIKQVFSDTITVTDNITVSNDETSNTQTIDQEVESSDEIERSSTSASSSNKTTTLDSSYLTSNSRFIGPVYGASYNYDVNKKVYQTTNSDGQLTTTEFNTIEASSISSLINGTGSAVSSSLHSLKGTDTDGNEVIVTYNNEVLTSFMSQLILPDNLAYNYVLMYNTLEDKNYLQSSIEDDLNMPLYMDFMGNIITESGYVVVPAIANATRMTDNSSSTFLHAMFINSYPKVSITSDGKFKLSDNDKNKFVFFRDNSSLFFTNDADTSFTNTYVENTLTTDIGKWFYNDKMSVGKLSSSGNSFTNTIEILFPRVDSYTESEVVNDYEYDEEETGSTRRGVYYKDSLISARGYDENANIINMFSLSNMQTHSYTSLLILKKSKAVFSWDKSYPILTLSIGNTEGLAQLNKIPTNLNSFEVAALTELNKNLLNLLYEQSGSIYTNLDLALSIVVALNNGSTDTSVNDFTFVDYKSRIKDDKLSYLTGSLFEAIYNPFVSDSSYNLLTYMPTINNLSSSTSIAQYLAMFLLVFLAVSILVILFLLATNAQRSSTMTIKDLGVSLLILLLIIVFVLKGLQPTSRFIFETLSNRALENPYLIMVLNNLENSMKDIETTYFSIDETTNTKEIEYPSIILRKITLDEANQYRELLEKPESEFIYMAQFDNSRLYIEDDMYIENLYLKIDLDDFLNASSIDVFTQGSYNIVYEQNVSDEANTLVYYTPYFHILESLTNTINKYSTATTNYYSTLNYDNGSVKTTGRVKSYIESIFFIAPSKIEEYIELNNQDPSNLEAQLKGNILASNVVTSVTDENDIVDYSGYVDTFINSSGEEIVITENIASALEYIMTIMNLQQPNDWLNLNYIFGTIENDVFSEEFIETTEKTRWFPVLTALNSNDELQNKILKVNNNVKKFILKYIYPISNTVSDENLLKIIALKATLEYNREFNSISKGIVSPSSINEGEVIPKITLQYLYPTTIEGLTADNDFLSKLIYIPLNDVFRSNGSSIGYYLANKVPLSGLIFSFIERLLFLIRFAVRYASLTLAVLMIITGVITYIMKKKMVTATLTRIIMLLSIIIFPLAWIEIATYHIQLYCANLYSTTVMLFINTSVSILFTFLYGLCIYYIIEFVKELFVSVRTELISDLSAIMSDTRDVVLDRSLPENYVSPNYEDHGINLNEAPYETYNEYSPTTTPSDEMFFVSKEDLNSLDKTKYNLYQSDDGNYYASPIDENSNSRPSQQIEVMGNTAHYIQPQPTQNSNTTNSISEYDNDFNLDEIATPSSQHHTHHVHHTSSHQEPYQEPQSQQAQQEPYQQPQQSSSQQDNKSEVSTQAQPSDKSKSHSMKSMDFTSLGFDDTPVTKPNIDNPADNMVNYGDGNESITNDNQNNNQHNSSTMNSTSSANTNNTQPKNSDEKLNSIPSLEDL